MHFDEKYKSSRIAKKIKRIQESKKTYFSTTNII